MWYLLLAVVCFAVGFLVGSVGQRFISGELKVTNARVGILEGDLRRHIAGSDRDVRVPERAPKGY